MNTDILKGKWNQIKAEEVRAKDLKPRVRKEVSEFAFRDTFGGKL